MTFQMKARALSVKECTWMSEECRAVDEPRVEEPQRDSLCLPNIFRPRRAKPLARAPSCPAYQLHYTARELLLEVLNRGAVRELVRRAACAKPGAHRPAYSQSREQGADLSEEEYAEALTWFSIVLQGGLSAGEDNSFGSELTLRLDGCQGVLKRNSFQNSLLSLSRLEDGDQLEALAAFCSHLSRRYQALHTPGPNLAVKKYRLSLQQGPCSLHLALLCDVSSGFVCNVCPYRPEQLQGRGRRAVVEQVVQQLLRPFCSRTHLVQLDASAWAQGGPLDLFSGCGLNVHLVPTVKRPAVDPTTSSTSSPVDAPHQRQRASEHALPQLAAHLQGWTGPALLPPAGLRGPAADVFLPGLWAALHTVCINTFVLHSLQGRGSGRGSGRQVHLAEFTRALASQLAADRSAPVPALPRLHSVSLHGTSVANLSKLSTNNISLAPAAGNEKSGYRSAARLQRWNTPGVCGLDNSGNSCYLNAVLQCLCSTVPLVEHLLNQDNRQELARCKCRVAEVFVRLLEEMWLGRSSSCSPVEARSVLRSILPQFNNNSQQDAQELLLFLLNALHDNLKKAAKHQMHSSVRQGRPGDSTIVSRLFEGELSSVTLCTRCGLQAHSAQAFTVLSLPIPADVIKCSIQDCLSLFFEQTVLTGAEQVVCSACELRRETVVITCLDRPPEILMLHLKRFGCKGRNQVKLRTNVVFSMRLDLTPFLSSSAQNSSCSSYRLYAVVNHAGHLNMGHYTALCHNALTRTWHCFDDSNVREVQDNLLQSPNAYLLLYSRKPFPKPKIHGL